MPDPIETWRIEQFSNTVEMLTQERGGKLRSAVTFKTGYSGKGAAPVNQVGETEAVFSSERYADTPNMETPLDRRWIYPRKAKWGKLIDDFDRALMGITPDGEFTQAGVMAMQRIEDVCIMESFFGPAKTGETGGTTKNFPAANDVAVNVVDPGETVADTGLNHTKLLKAREILAKGNVDLDMEELYIAITEREVTNLFGYNFTTSTEFVEGRPVSTGKLPPLYGFNFIPFSSQTFTKLGLLANGVASLPVWVKSGMHLGLWKDRTTRVRERDDKEFNVQIYMDEFMGATRLQESKVVRVFSSHA